MNLFENHKTKANALKKCIGITVMVWAGRRNRA